MTKSKYIILIALIVGGCASTGVIPMSQDSYYIGKKDGTPGLGVSFGNKMEVYQEANAFCTQKRQELYVLKETVIPAAPGRLGSTELHFKCVVSGGTAQPLKKEADVVIEVQQR